MGAAAIEAVAPEAAAALPFATTTGAIPLPLLLLLLLLNIVCHHCIADTAFYRTQNGWVKMPVTCIEKIIAMERKAEKKSKESPYSDQILWFRDQHMLGMNPTLMFQIRMHGRAVLGRSVLFVRSDERGEPLRRVEGEVVVLDGEAEGELVLTQGEEPAVLGWYNVQHSFFPSMLEPRNAGLLRMLPLLIYCLRDAVNA